MTCKLLKKLLPRADNCKYIKEAVPFNFTTYIRYNMYPE